MQWGAWRLLLLLLRSRSGGSSSSNLATSAAAARRAQCRPRWRATGGRLRWGVLLLPRALQRQCSSTDSSLSRALLLPLLLLLMCRGA